MKTGFRKALYYIVPWMFILISLYTIFSKAIWIDEVYSLELAKHPFIDVHPPLYYMIVRVAFLLLGGIIDHIYIGKLVSVIPYIILLIIGYTYIKKVYGIRVAFIFNMFVVGMPQMLLYATEIRMYAWGMLFVTCAFLQLPRIIDGEKNNWLNYVLLSVFSALAAYTHYFACASAIVIYIELFIMCIIRKDYKKIWSVLLSGLAVVVMYLPWLFVFLSQVSAVSESYWIEPVSLKGIISNFLFLFYTNRVLEVIILIVFLAGLVGVFFCSKEKRYIALCGIGTWAGTIVMGVLLSIIIRPIFISRYVLGAAACMWFAIAIGLDKLINDRVKDVYVYTILLISCCLVGVLYLKSEIDEKNKISNTLSAFDNYIDSNTIIVTDNNHTQCTASYYYINNESLLYYPENDTQKYDSGLTELTLSVYNDCLLKEISNADELEKYSDKRILVLDRHGSLKDSLEGEGYSLDYIGKYWINRHYVESYIIER